MDIEVLDAIAFREANGKEVVINMPISKVQPHIVDAVGDGLDKAPAAPTRRTHVKRITSASDPTQFFDVEVLDAAAMNDIRGGEWTLVMPAESAVPFDTTDGGAGSNTTRRTHLEKVSSDPSVKNPVTYVTVERCDMIAFRKVNGEEVILKMPSGDDPNNSDAPRADTFVTPKGYDPTDASSPTPPNLADSGDAHFYVKLLPDGDLNTGDAKISQGPFWWIRKIGSSAVVFVEVSYNCSSNLGPPPRPSIKIVNMPYTAGPGQWDVLGSVNQLLPGAKSVPVKNPVTDAMLNSFHQWTPAPLIETNSNATDPGETLYYVRSGQNFASDAIFFPGFVPPPEVTKDNYNLLWGYAGRFVPIVFAWGDGVFTSDAGGFPGAPTATGAHPGFADWALRNGYDLPRLLNFEASNTTTSQADAQYWLSAFTTGNAAQLSDASKQGAATIESFTISKPTARYTLQGTAVFEINLSPLIDAWAKRSPSGPITFSLAVDLVSSGSDSAAGMSVQAEAYKKLLNFSLDDKNKPTFDPWLPNPPLPLATDGGKPGTSGAYVFNGGSTSIILTATIDPKTLDITFSS